MFAPILESNILLNLFSKTISQAVPALFPDEPSPKLLTKESIIILNFLCNSRVYDKKRYQPTLFSQIKKLAFFGRKSGRPMFTFEKVCAPCNASP